MGMLMKNGVPYASGSEIPEGGTKGQVLAKASDISGDFEWVNGGGGGGGNATFDVTPIPYGPTGAHEINATVSNKDNENARVSYVRQSDGTLPSTVNLGVKSGLGEDTFELPTKALVDTKQDALTTGQGARIRGNVIDTPLLDEIPAIGNRSSFYDDHFYESVKQSNTVYTAKYKSAEDRQVVYNADLTDYYWRVKYENNTEEFIELRNRRITQAGGTTDVVRYDTYKIFTNEPYKHVTPDIMWIDIVQNAEAQYVFGTYGKSYTAEQMGHPRAMSMTPYAKTMIKKLSDIVKTDLFLQGIIEEKGSSWGVAKAGKVRFVFASPTTTICDLNIDISELGLTSTNDYVIQMTISGGGKMDWGASELWTWGGSATSIGVTCRNDINKNNDFVDVDYVIVAKGFGGGSGGSGGGTVDQTYDATSTNAQSGTAVAEALASKALSPTGWGVVRTGVATVEFNNSKWSSSATVDVSDLGFSSGADYDVVAQPTTGGTAAPWGNAVAFVNANKGASSFSVSSVTMEESLNGTVNVKYTIFAKGYGAVAYTGEIPTGGTTGQILTKRSDADGDYGWETGGGSGTVDTAMSDTSENAVQNKVIKAYVDDADAELQKHKATGYFERTDYPITLDTVGQRSYALARDVFTVEIESHKPYTYEFTASDVYDLTRYVETTGKTFVAMNEDNETIYITMNGALPDNVQYVAGSTNPVVDLTNATVTLTKTTFLQQIDDMLIPRTSGEVFVFDVDSDQFTEDPENPGGKHNGMTIDSPTFDEIMDNLVAGKIVFVRMTFNGGNSYDFYQLSRESQQGIRGKAFDLEFPQGHIWFYDIYIKKRGIGTNATTYFGVFADKVVDGGGGTVDAYTKEETNALLGEKASLNIAAIHGGGGGDEISATVSQGTDSVNVNYYKDSEPPNSLNLNIGEDSFRVPTTDYVDGAVGDLTMLTTTNKSSAVAAINEIDFAVKGLGEPFRVKQWGSNTLNVEIPYCTEDIANASIPKMVYSIDDVEGADYQIVGMLAYEVFDAASGGNRINCFPVCQFTGNGQKELSVRWACMGTTRKTAKRINAWVLLKHR